MKILVRFVSFAAALLLTGCVTSYPVWKYNGQIYDTALSGEAAARKDMRRLLADVTPLKEPVAGSVLIFSPTVARSRRAVVVTGNASGDFIDYVATVLYYGFREVPDAIQRRGIFKQTTIEEMDRLNPAPHPESDYMVWLRLSGPDAAEWVISQGGTPGTYRELNISPINEPHERTEQMFAAIAKYIEDHPAQRPR